MNINPALYLDGYKTFHDQVWPKGTELVYSNFTHRKSRVSGVDYMVLFGLQYAIKEYLINRFNEEFFAKGRDNVVSSYTRRMNNYLGPNSVTISNIEKLHDLGYLPIVIKALPEGTKVPIGCPAFVIYNTHPEFFWLTNYLETMLSSLIWGPSTSATTASVFRKVFEKYAAFTGADPNFIKFQGHDFSYRGMFGTEAAELSGAGHLLSFVGTDTIPAIDFLENYYNADSDKELVGCSVPATEHSCSSASIISLTEQIGGTLNIEEKFRCSEEEFVRRLITETVPSGIISIVSDTFDFWRLVTKILPRLKSEILERWEKNNASKVVIRPDSGVPNLIINGDPDSTVECEKKGLLRCLQDIFGSTRNDAGYYNLHPCIGAIYGDSIDLEMQDKILHGMMDNFFCSSNIVMGLGSYTYQYTTRDVYGTVCKSVYCEVGGRPYNLFKSPKTGAWKASHKGLLRVNEDLTYEQEVSWDREGGMMVPVFKDGELLVDHGLGDIRDRLQNG